jgi:hypothetical protein
VVWEGGGGAVAGDFTLAWFRHIHIAFYEMWASVVESLGGGIHLTTSIYDDVDVDSEEERQLT